MEFKKREIKRAESNVSQTDLNAVKEGDENSPPVSPQNIVVQVRSELFEYRMLQSLALAFEQSYIATNYQQAGRVAVFMYSLESVGGEPGKVVQFWNNALRSVNKQAYYSMHNAPVTIPNMTTDDSPNQPEKKTGGCSSCAEKAKARAAQREKEKAALEAAAKADRESKENRVKDEV